MVKYNKERENPEDIERFGLLIHKTPTPDGAEFHIDAQSEGLPEAEVILLVDAWLQQTKENFQKPIRDGLMFGGAGKPSGE